MDGKILPTVPAGPPPPGVHSNFIDPINRAPNLIACNVILLVVSTVVVGARIISRTLLTDWRLGWDDYTIIMAFVGTAIFGSFVIETTHFGLGKHIWDVPMTTYTPQYLWWIMATFAACPASYYFVKISILLFYLRVFQLQAKLRYMIYALMVYCTIYYWVAFSTVIGLCNVRNRQWDITVTMNCFAYGKLTFAIGGLDLVADALILGFPIPMVMKLRISWAQRIYLLFVFLAGLIASIACAIRVAFAVQSRGTTDATFAQYRVVTLFCIEHYFALIAACMPTLGPFFKWLRPNHWKHVAIGPQSIGHGRYGDPEAFERVWPRPSKTPSDDTLLGRSSVAPEAEQNDPTFSYSVQAHQSRAQTPQYMERVWVKSDAHASRKGDLKNEMELQARDTASQSS
ncbi:hypothetical protein HO133_004162 [Letharia lupina]|uniref:Rhodopsin domain-containing protein n=1 Tax=Letharia lupina TaxID=560253 RepID=A0A8H6F9I7_9LECA|nr:uncharacterized protein HO133_004162 [Letharia lupina]KAF6219693.1 hypothetical protein HO133_004162 [Letharia lupina]